MAWPWRRERGRHAGPVARRPVAVAVPEPVTVPVPTPLAGPEQVDVPLPAGAATPGVLLGFGDGSEVQLPPGDPSAQALRAVADVLLNRRPGPAETGRPTD